MKIRSGFISNSSTSCFILYGIEVDTDKVDMELIKDTDLKLEEICPYNGREKLHILGTSLGYFESYEVSDLDVDGIVKVRDELKRLFPDKQPKLYSKVSPD